MVATPDSVPTQPTPTREWIKSLASDFYVLRGHDGFSFGDIATAIGTTRANIHYHFGSKQQMMKELIDEFVSDADRRITAHWTTPRHSFTERLEAQLQDFREFYVCKNPRRGDRHVWSPIARLRLDLPKLGEPAAAALEAVNGVYAECLQHAVSEAVTSGEFRRETPVQDVACLLRVTFLSCAPLTQDTGSFDEVEHLFAALRRTLFAAWG